MLSTRLPPVIAMCASCGLGDDALGFEETLRFNFFEGLRKLIFELGDHGWIADYADLDR